MGWGRKSSASPPTPILCGDRNAAGQRWQELVDSTWRRLAEVAPMAAEHGITVAIENHQDFTSAELVALCVGTGDNVGIVFDTANTFPVAESPLDFAATIAAHVRYLHLKDYNVQFTSEGYRLVRCPTGDGAVPFRQMMEILSRHHETLPAAIEIGALEARHVRLFTPDWWQGYAPKGAPALAAALLAAQRNRLPDDAGLPHAVGEGRKRRSAGRVRARPGEEKRRQFAGARAHVIPDRGRQPSSVPAIPGGRSFPGQILVNIYLGTGAFPAPRTDPTRPVTRWRERACCCAR